MSVLIEKSDILEKVFSNITFKEEAKNLKTVEDLQKLFSNYDIELTLDEVKEICCEIAKQMQNSENGELNENDLEQVSGGVAWGLIALGVACLGAFALGVYNGL